MRVSESSAHNSSAAEVIPLKVSDIPSKHMLSRV